MTEAPVPSKPIYLDHSATTPIAQPVLDAMRPVLLEQYGNASASHALGRSARAALEGARSACAAELGCAPHELVFTSGGSESDNLAVRGAAAEMRKRGRGHHVVTTAIEHEAVLHTARDMENDGFSLTVVGVDQYGCVGVEEVLRAIRPETSLVSVMLANNEVGSLQPVRALAAALRDGGHDVLLHTDAVQTPLWTALDMDELGVDMLSLSAHKFYGPKGVGLLYARDGVPLRAVQTGGGQERGRRAGTENVAGAVGLAAALRWVAQDRDSVIQRVTELRDRLLAGLLALPGVALSGHPVRRMPHHASITVEGVAADLLLLGLDMRGICASSGAACAAGIVEPSYVLEAMNLPADAARGALRFTLGRDSTGSDIDHVLDVLPRLIEASRRASAPR